MAALIEINYDKEHTEDAHLMIQEFYRDIFPSWHDLAQTE
jgi:hypothetical protein